MRLGRVRWLNDVWLPLTVSGMEASWLTQGAAWLTTPASEEGGVTALPWPMVAGLLLLATMSTRFLLQRQWPLERVRLIVIALASLSLLTVVRLWYYPERALLDASWLADLLGNGAQAFTAAPRLGVAMLVVALVWHRGIGTARNNLTLEKVYDYFLTGVVAQVVLSLFRPVWARASGGVEESHALSVMVFFVCGLVALAISRLELVRSAAQGNNELVPGLNRQWLMLLVAVLVGILATAVLAAGLFSFDLVGNMMGAAVRLTTIVFYALILLSLPILFALEYFIYALRWLFSLLGLGAPGPPPRLRNMEELEREKQEVEPSELPPEVIAVLHLVIVGLLAVIIITILLRAVFRLWSMPQERTNEVRDSVWSWRAAWAGLLSGLRALWQRLFRSLPTVAQAARAGESSLSQEPGTRSIRELYRRFLSWAAQHGLRRRPEQTPYEFLSEFRLGLPARWEQVATLTALYVSARYNSAPPSEGDVLAATEAWNRLRVPAAEG